jgi:hypothetical protein
MNEAALGMKKFCLPQQPLPIPLAGNFLAVNYQNQKLANISIFKAITSKCPGEAIMHCQKTGSPTHHNKTNGGLSTVT